MIDIQTLIDRLMIDVVHLWVKESCSDSTYRKWRAVRTELMMNRESLKGMQDHFPEAKQTAWKTTHEPWR